VKRYIFFPLLIVIIASGCHKEDKKFAQPKAEPNPVVDLRDANQLLAQKRCPDAIVAYQKFLAKNPKDAGGWNSIGLAYLCNKQSQDALTSFNQALVIAPTYTDVHNNLGVAYMEVKNYPEAKNEFKKALDDPNYPTSGPYFNLAKLAFLQDNFEEARALSKKVVTILPNEAGPRLLYSMSLEKLGRLDEAATSFRELLKISPGNLEACYHMGNVLMQQKQNCEAREYFSKVVDADPLGELGQRSIAAMKNLQCNSKPKSSSSQ
jgi:Tfp pilus assembly protein PilF